jgi:hypothetical protein
MGSHPGVVHFGFEATAEDVNGDKKGTLIITDAAQTKLVNANRAVTHTSGGITPFGNDKTWTFDWTAPDSGTGDITFYAAFNAANGNGSTSGDVIYLSSTTYPENTGVGINEDFANAAALKIFPNPASEFVDVTWKASEYAMKEISVFSLNGAKVQSHSLSGNLDNRVRLSVSDLQTGHYLVTLVSLDGSQASLPLIIR